MICGLGTVEMFCTVTLILTGIWYYLVANYNFWKQLGVPGPRPSIFFGNFKDIMLARGSFPESLKQMCDQFPGAPIVGVYRRRTPILLLRDPELIKDVLIKDFSNFSERNRPLFEKNDPLFAHLNRLETKRWRPLRAKLLPVFSSSKMKQMYCLILECTENLVKHIDTLVDKGDAIDCQKVTARFTIDVIGNCAFGLQSIDLVNEDSEFMKIGEKLFVSDIRAKIFIALRAVSPWLYELLGQSVFPNGVTPFFMSLVKETMDLRRNSSDRRGDFIDRLIEIKDNSDDLDFEFTDALITAQAFVFFAAGFQPSASTISHALLELAQRQDLQEKLRREIVESLEANNGNITYDSVKGLTYLHMVFQETLRLRPPFFMLERKAMENYTFKDLNVTIPKGLNVWIPLWEIHQNPDYYPNPEVFDPERFTEENSESRHPMTYLPFGNGPRNCIGGRFASFQTKVGLIKILANYKVEVCEKTRLPFKLSSNPFLVQPVGGVHLKFSKLGQSH